MLGRLRGVARRKHIRGAASIRTLQDIAPPVYKSASAAQSARPEVPDFRAFAIAGNGQVDRTLAHAPMEDPAFPEALMREARLASPELEFTQLDNGLRIVSSDRQGLASSLGLFIRTGSRYERPEELGASHMVELTAFKSTSQVELSRIVKILETLGVEAKCQAAREHIWYSMETLREYVPVCIPLLAGSALDSKLVPEEVLECRELVRVSHDIVRKNPEQYVQELATEAAYENNTLGNPLFAPEENLEDRFTSDFVRKYMAKHFHPDNMVMVGVNVSHKEFVGICAKAFSQFTSAPVPRAEYVKPRYTGGYRLVPDSHQSLVHVVVAFETGGWLSEDLVSTTVLQMLLGGGGSFSTGGPGKGMHSRLYLNVLNTLPWVESCQSFNTMYSDGGLFGFYLTAHPSHAAKLPEVAANEVRKMGYFSQEELSRAKNALQSSIYMNLENRSVLAEDIGRQLMMSGKAATGEEFCAFIEQVTADDLVRCAQKIFSGKPTLLVYGDCSEAPAYENVVKLFGPDSPSTQPTRRWI
jgi:processing peptidase subunit alpha